MALFDKIIKKIRGGKSARTTKGKIDIMAQENELIKEPASVGVGEHENSDDRSAEASGGEYGGDAPSSEYADLEYDGNAVGDAKATVDSDLLELRSNFGELSEIKSITELPNPERYAALREMGLSVYEAYLATTPRAAAPDNRAHLTSGVPAAARAPFGSMTRQELNSARELFSDMDDSEIQKLYQKVTR